MRYALGGSADGAGAKSSRYSPRRKSSSWQHGSRPPISQQCTSWSRATSGWPSRLRTGTRHTVPEEDRRQTALVALVIAARKFKPGTEARRFAPFARRIIRDALIELASRALCSGVSIGSDRDRRAAVFGLAAAREALGDQATAARTWSPARCFSRCSCGHRGCGAPTRLTRCGPLRRNDRTRRPSRSIARS